MSQLALKLWANPETMYEYEIAEDGEGYAIWRGSALRGKHIARNIPTLAEAVQMLADTLKDEVTA